MSISAAAVLASRRRRLVQEAVELRPDGAKVDTMFDVEMTRCPTCEVMFGKRGPVCLVVRSKQSVIGRAQLFP